MFGMRQTDVGDAAPLQLPAPTVAPTAELEPAPRTSCRIGPGRLFVINHTHDEQRLA
jgi:hypothetical protein